MKRRLILWITTATLTAVLASASTAHAVPSWAPVGQAAITPGVTTLTEGAECTANFIYYDRSDKVYIGQAAHCSSTSPPEAIDGCQAESLPIGTKVLVAGATRPGVMVYNSWITMQQKKETDENACAFNDLALIQLDPADYGRVNPSVPHWGGPTGLSTGARISERVFGYGNSPLRLRTGLLNAIEGMVLGQQGNGWSYRVHFLVPGVPGDSGSGFLDSQGRALGTLSTLGLFPETLSNGVSDLRRQLDYMRANSPYDVTVANGTQPFRGAISDLEKLLGGLLAGLLGGG
ncbi:MAG TPA: serine protease [Actinomycetota bacterium]|nr:serine protease [Actinomycetota bacterium]